MACIRHLTIRCSLGGEVVVMMTSSIRRYRPGRGMIRWDLVMGLDEVQEDEWEGRALVEALEEVVVALGDHLTRLEGLAEEILSE